jgi:hypothetical protein
LLIQLKASENLSVVIMKFSTSENISIASRRGILYSSAQRASSLNFGREFLGAFALFWSEMCLTVGFGLFKGLAARTLCVIIQDPVTMVIALPW